MRTVLTLIVAAGIGGCAVVPPAAWDFDPTRPAPAAARAPQDVAPMTQRLAQLQIERDAIRSRISGERNARQRLALYDELHRVGVQLSPLERQLGRQR